MTYKDGSKDIIKLISNSYGGDILDRILINITYNQLRVILIASSTILVKVRYS